MCVFHIFGGPFTSGNLSFGLRFLLCFCTISLINFFLVYSPGIPAKWMLNILDCTPLFLPVFSPPPVSFHLPLSSFLCFSVLQLLSFYSVLKESSSVLFSSPSTEYSNNYFCRQSKNIFLLAESPSPPLPLLLFGIFVSWVQCLLSQATSYKCVLKFYSVLSIVCLPKVIFLFVSFCVFCDGSLAQISGDPRLSFHVWEWGTKKWIGRVCLWVRICQLVAFARVIVQELNCFLGGGALNVSICRSCLLG